ncbi:hypothetical protein I6E85_18500 [Pseudoalteromonas sp. NZS71]|uniref:GTP pyrophosphokinase n=2 Tax=Pseudoalteromonas TaxID=53246 RepID=UPI00041C278A|nr:MULTISPECIES: hypothetical protein [unclassified Pseudoalteromonas]MBH0063122.1 hypothetical protein [Pseudoalteromonas sp. NZS71]
MSIFFGVTVSSFLESYKELKPQFERLEENVCTCLKQVFCDGNIPIFDVESRVKDDASVKTKISSKGYKNPLEEIDDFCGVRVICYYQEDIEKICAIIQSEFDVIKEENKQEELSDNQFGYTSFHYVIRLKPEWLGHPSARGLDGFRAEIQIRTMLMHTWAAISHKLLYKIEEDIPSSFKRKLNRLSALIELADEQFNQIKNEKAEYNESLISPDSSFDSSGELNSDSLMAVKSYYFNDRNVNDSDIPILLDEIRKCELSLFQLVSNIKRCIDFLPQMEKEEAADSGHDDLPMWGFSGVIRTVLDISCKDYFESRLDSLPVEVIESRDKYRPIYESKI